LHPIGAWQGPTDLSVVFWKGWVKDGLVDK